MNYLLKAVLFILPGIFSTFSGAAVHRTEVKINYPIEAPYYPVVLTGELLPALTGHEAREITVWSVNAGKFVPVPFQVDSVDEDGIFELPPDFGRGSKITHSPFDDNDELVLMASDLGSQATPDINLPPDRSMVEVELLDPHSGSHGWFYILLMKDKPVSRMLSARDYVQYDPARDSIKTGTFMLSFSPQTPFLADTLQWSINDGTGFSRDVIDAMKIRHDGLLFHVFPFTRTQDDYSSKLVAVKDGPVRVIRRTSNKVRIMLGIGSPAVDIDQIVYRNAFVMDIIVDMPFRIGAIFSDLTAVPTIDGLNGPGMPPTFISSESDTQGFAVSGKVADLKRKFNQSGDRILAISSELGLVVGDIAVKEGSSIDSRVYLVDDETLLDAPEEAPGQYNNAGFMMTGWEKLDSQVNHILFRSYLLQQVPVVDGIELLKRSPRLQ